MDPCIIDGRTLAGTREEVLKENVSTFVSKFHRRPTLVAVEISEDPGSVLYLKLKRAAAERMGIEFKSIKRSDPAYSGSDLVKFSADGIFIQHPPGYNKAKWQELVDWIPPEKDVDCLTSANLVRIKGGSPRFLPATVKAIGYCLAEALSKMPIPKRKRSALWRRLLARIWGKSVVIFGRSPMVGLPLSWWLESFGARVDVVHSQTKHDEQKTKSRNADILISTVGKPGIITRDMVKDGAIVIDSGSPKGDVDFESVLEKAFAITPVPGGVGPLTVVSLMENVVESAHLADQKSS